MHPPGFSSYHGYGNLLAHRIYVHILGHAGRILMSYLDDLCDHDIQAFYCNDAARESKFCHEPCLALSIPEIFGLFSSTSRKSLPMGVN
jgi:hypothetical protein